MCKTLPKSQSVEILYALHVNTAFSDLGRTEERSINGENKRKMVERAHMFMQESLVLGFGFVFRLEVHFIWCNRETGESTFRHVMKWNHFRSTWLSGMTWKNGPAVVMHSLFVCVS